MLRAGIAASLAEGAAVGVVFNVLEQWLVPLLHVRLGAQAWVIFLLTLLPLVAYVVTGPFVTAIIRRLGGARLTTVRIGWFQAACLAALLVPTCVEGLPLALPLAVLLAVAVPASMAISQPAWFAWMGGLVPPGLHGAYFGRRNRLFMLWKLGAAGLFGLVLHLLPLTDGPSGMAVILGAAVAARVVAVLMLLRQPEPPERPLSRSGRLTAAPPGGFIGFVRRLPDDHFGRFTLVWSVLFTGVMIAGPAFAPYMLTPVEEGGLGLADQPLLFTALVASSQIMRLLAYPLVGRLVDMVGPTLVLRYAIVGMTLLPLVWVVVTDVWVLIAVEVLNGLCWCAAECAALVILMGCHRSADGRSLLIGWHQTLLGLVQMVAVAAGMLLLPLLPGLDGSSFRTLFLVSILLRIPALILVWTYLPRLPLRRRLEVRGLWRELPGVGLVATISHGAASLMRRIVPWHEVQPPRKDGA